jgi:hypothetical protein
LTIQVIVLATQNSVEFKDMGTATSAVTFFRTMGGAIGTSFFGNILVNRLTFNLNRLGAGKSASNAASSLMGGSPKVLDKLPPLIHQGILEAFVKSLHVVFLFAIPFAAVAIIFALILPEKPLRSVAAIAGGSKENDLEAPLFIAE